MYESNHYVIHLKHIQCYTSIISLLTKKDAQCESCELNFIWGKILFGAKCGVAQEAAPQIAPRDCSKGAVRGRSIYEILVKGEFDTIKHSFYKRFSASHEDLMSS